MRLSLSHRLIMAVVVVLTAFLTLAAFALHTMYQERALASLKTELLGHVYTLLSAAEEDSNGLMKLAEHMPDPRLNRPDSGLYAQVYSEQSSYSWQSASMLDKPLRLTKTTLPGKQLYQQTDDYLTLNFGVAWDDYDGQSWHYTISIATSLDEYKQNMQGFRRSLLQWLGGSALLLIIVQLLVLRWGLIPLKKAEREIKQVEAGKQDFLQGNYPDELRGLTGNINSLIAHSQSNQQRYRNSLGDLAHSLKTPLALLQAARDQADPKLLQQALDEQLPNIDAKIQYQLQRASLMGKTTVARAIILKPVVEKIIRGLSKVYHEKAIKSEILISDDLVFHGDQNDLFELLGNLIDNAFKYCNGRVVVSAKKNAVLTICVEDDGKGMADVDKQSLLKRGVRADQQMPGQGIGLGIVNEIVSLYDAKLSIGQSQLGGARVEIEF